MAAQSYATHRHPPKLTFVGLLFFMVALVGYGFKANGVGLLGLLGSIFMLLFISRSYTTALQDRIIKLEMRVRCASILTSAQQATVGRLGKAQLIALRFASDAELPALAEQAEREHLSADQIKRAIKNWVPDWDRT